MENEKKERGGCLTAFLGVFIVFNGLGVLTEVFSIIKKPGAVIIISTILSIISLVSLIAVFYWKKIGAIGYAAAYIGSTIVTVLSSNTAANAVISAGVLKACTVIFAVIILVIFYILIKPVYKYME